MGTSTSSAQFAAKIAKAGDNLRDAEKVAVSQAALAGKQIMLANMGFTRMSGVGRSGAKVGVRYDIKGGTNPTALLRYTGPVHLANNPTAAHRIEPRSKGRNAKRAVTPGGDPRAGANHPGTAGKKFFERSKPQVRKAAGPILRRSVTSALNRSF